MVEVISFFRNYLKIILLVGLPVYGLSINYVVPLVIPYFSIPTFYAYFLIFLNIGANSIGAMLNLPFFYNTSMFQYEWFIHPILNLASNLIFWIPVAIVINRYLEKRYKKWLIMIKKILIVLTVYFLIPLGVVIGSMIPNDKHPTSNLFGKSLKYSLVYSLAFWNLPAVIIGKQINTT